MNFTCFKLMKRARARHICGAFPRAVTGFATRQFMQNDDDVGAKNRDAAICDIDGEKKRGDGLCV